MNLNTYFIIVFSIFDNKYPHRTTLLEKTAQLLTGIWALDWKALSAKVLF